METTIDKHKGKKYKVWCNKCRCETNHIVVFSIEQSGDSLFSGYDISWFDSYEILQCQGCDTICFRNENGTDDDNQWDPETGETIYVTHETIYPRRTKETINSKNFTCLPYNLNKIYLEAVDCYNNDNKILCGGGVRALVEGICKEQGIEGGSVTIDKNGQLSKKRRTDLSGKINGLHEKGILTESSAKVLHHHRFMGNESMHELAMPSKNELSLAIKIIEHILENIYELPGNAEQLEHERKKNKKSP